MTAQDFDPAALAAVKSTVETTSLVGALAVLLVAKGIVTAEEMDEAVDEIRGIMVREAAARYDLPAAELAEVLK